MCRDCIRSHLPAVCMCRPRQGQSPFQNAIIMAQKRSLHLCINNNIRSIPISMLPVRLWRCKAWIFGGTHAWMHSDHAGMMCAPVNTSICTKGVVIAVCIYSWWALRQEWSGGSEDSEDSEDSGSDSDSGLRFGVGGFGGSRFGFGFGFGFDMVRGTWL